MSYRDLSDAELADLANKVSDEAHRRTACAATIAQIKQYLGLADTSLADLGLQEIPPVDPPVDPPIDPPVDPPAEVPASFAVLAHVPDGKANFWLAIANRPWATGAFIYYPGPWGHSHLEWDPYWAAAVAANPEGLDTVVSPKSIDQAKLIEFCENLPQAWRDKMVFAYYQEPEDNFKTQAEIDAFRAQVKIAGQIVRPYGIRNAVELQEWSLDPSNGTYPSGQTNTARFVDTQDIDHISWSVYEKNLKNRSGVMIGRIASFMALFPELTWDISATGVAVPGGTPATDPKRATRALITSNMISLAKSHPKCTGFGWFDFPAWTPTLDYGADDQLRATFTETL